MAKKSVWVWVGIIAAVLVILFGLCACIGVWWVYNIGQRSNEAKKYVERARPLIEEADATLSKLDAMNSALPSEEGKANRAIKDSADLPNAKDKLTEARDYLAKAAEVGAGGDVGRYVDAKLGSTRSKLDVVDLRSRQAHELKSARKAAVAANGAKPRMDNGMKLVNESATWRNKDNYTKAQFYLKKGSGLMNRAFALYKQAERAYPKADYDICIRTLNKAREAVRYKTRLDQLGTAGNYSRYNEVRNSSNTAWDAAFALWKRTENQDDATVVDKAYAAAVKELVERISAKESSAARKDSEAGSLDSSGGSSESNTTNGETP